MVSVYKTAVDMHIKLINKLQLFSTEEKILFFTQKQLFDETQQNNNSGGIADELKDIDLEGDNIDELLENKLNAFLEGEIAGEEGDELTINIALEKMLLLQRYQNFIKAARPRQLWNDITDNGGIGMIKHNETKGLLEEFNKESADAAQDIILRTADPEIEGRTYTSKKYNYADVKNNQTVILCGGVEEDLLTQTAKGHNGSQSRSDFVYSRGIKEYAHERNEKNKDKRPVQNLSKILASCMSTSIVEFHENDDRHDWRTKGIVTEFEKSVFLPRLNEYSNNGNIEEAKLNEIINDLDFKDSTEDNLKIINSSDEDIKSSDIWAQAFNLERGNTPRWCTNEFKSSFSKTSNNLDRLTRKSIDIAYGLQILSRKSEIIQHYDNNTVVKNKIVPLYMIDKQAMIG
eukprot:188783_1